MNATTFFNMNRRVLLLALGYVLILSGALSVVLHPQLRAQAREFLLSDYRQVLSTVAGDLRQDGSQIKVVKIRTRDHLILEFYLNEASGATRLLQSIALSDKKDAYFNFHGEATNLVLTDLNGDQKAEILVPSFDNSLRAKINVFHFDPALKLFAQFTGQSDQTALR